jgi:hypothetical protein
MSVIENWHNDCNSLRDHGVSQLHLHLCHMRMMAEKEISLAKWLNGKPLVDSAL